MRGAASAAPFRLRTKSEDNVTIETATAQPTFSKFLGIRIVDIKPERVTAELAVREEFKNRGGVMHGGAVMAFADSLGGTAANANLREGQRTSTIESKTNFFAGIPIGDTAHAECVPLHVGRSTIVLQTRITRGDGKLAAVVTQTQIVLEKRTRDPESGNRFSDKITRKELVPNTTPCRCARRRGSCDLTSTGRPSRISSERASVSSVRRAHRFLGVEGQVREQDHVVHLVERGHRMLDVHRFLAEHVERSARDHLLA